MTTILANGANVSRSQRRRVISDVVLAWYRVDPNYAKQMADFMRELCKVERADGEWRGKKGFTKLRLPSDLFHTLRAAFNRFLPDEPTFGATDDDITLLKEEFPALVPTGARTARGTKGRRSA